MKLLMYLIIYLYIEACQILTRQHNKVQHIYSVCVESDQSRLELVESLSFLIVSVYFLSSSQLRYNIKFLVIYNFNVIAI